MGHAKNLDQQMLVCIDPRHWRQSTRRSVNALWKILLEDQSDNAGKKTLNQV
jgi:hypothetical protein